MSDIVAIYALLAVLFCVGSIPLIRLFLNTKRDLFEPVYWASAYFILIFGIRSIYAMLFGTPFLGNPPFSLETVNAWIIAVDNNSKEVESRNKLLKLIWHHL